MWITAVNLRLATVVLSLQVASLNWSDLMSVNATMGQASSQKNKNKNNNKNKKLQYGAAVVPLPTQGSACWRGNLTIPATEMFFVLYGAWKPRVRAGEAGS
jgi:hypothetical protein